MVPIVMTIRNISIHEYVKLLFLTDSTTMDVIKYKRKIPSVDCEKAFLQSFITGIGGLPKKIFMLLNIYFLPFFLCLIPRNTNLPVFNQLYFIRFRYHLLIRPFYYLS